MEEELTFLRRSLELDAPVLEPERKSSLVALAKFAGAVGCGAICPPLSDPACHTVFCWVAFPGSAMVAKMVYAPPEYSTVGATGTLNLRVAGCRLGDVESRLVMRTEGEPLLCVATKTLLPTIDRKSVV